MKTTIGIDPGMTGGFAAINADGIELFVMPTYKTKVKRKGKLKTIPQIDEPAIVSWLAQYKSVRVCLEKVHAMPGQGVTSMFNFGASWGIVRGILSGMGIPYELVTPQVWQKVMLPDEESEYGVASKLWPQADWLATPRCRVPHDGLLDAALIAEYSRRSAK